MIAGVDYPAIAVTFLCHDDQGNILFHKRSQNCRDEKGRWDWGGGKMELGETIEQAVLREIKEEYGCSGIIEFSFPPLDYFGQQENFKTHWIVLGHLVRVNKAEVINNEPRSIEEIGWFSWDNLPQPLHRGVQEDIKIYKPYLEKLLK